jgi:hypothetical protein
MKCEWVIAPCNKEAVTKIGNPNLEGLLLCAEHHAEWLRHFNALKGKK